MLADLCTKSHPQSRLAALRRMWSIEGIDTSYDPEKIPKEGLSSSDEKTSEEEKQKRIERLQNARNRKKELEEENKQLESEYFKKKEIEIYNELYAQFEKKLNKKKKEVKTKVMQKELESDSDSEIEQKQVKQTKNKKVVIEKETKHNGGYIPPASSNPTPLFRICN
jgi:hypothetical protein